MILSKYLKIYDSVLITSVPFTKNLRGFGNLGGLAPLPRKTSEVLETSEVFGRFGLQKKNDKDFIRQYVKMI